MVVDIHRYRQVAVLIVLAQEIPPLLLSVQRYGIRIDVDNHPPGTT
jgi:hypothetical protein